MVPTGLLYYMHLDFMYDIVCVSHLSYFKLVVMLSVDCACFIECFMSLYTTF